MAGTSESEIDAFSAVSRAINDFPSENDVPETLERYLEQVTDLPVLTSTRIDHSTGSNGNTSQPCQPNSVDSCKAEIQNLEQEISQLEDAIFQEDYRLLEIRLSTLDDVMKHFSFKRKHSDAVTDDEDIMKKLQLQEAFTGIHFHDVTSKVLEQSDERTIRIQMIEGSCSDLEFKVKFEVIETEVGERSEVPALAEQEQRAQVTNLEISVDHEWVKRDISTFIEAMVQSCSLQPFLRGFQQYARQFLQRKSVYDHFEKTYPECVKLYPNNDLSILQFIHPVHKGIVYTVTWSISISNNTSMEENFTLDVFANEQMQMMDRRNILQNAPDKFQEMIGLMGIEKTLDTLIGAVSSY